MNTLFNHIEKVMKRKGADTRTLFTVRDCFQKVELCMGHRLCAVNQQRAVSKVLIDMWMRAIQGEGLDGAIVTIGFKINAEPVLFRDNTMEHDRESGMKWHGAMVHFWTVEPEVTDPGQKFSEQKLYYNYISTADSSDAKYVASGLIEAVLIDIKRDLPQIKRVVIHSENTPIYQNAFVAVALPILGFAHGIEVTRFIQTEAEAGTSLLDTQFARVARKVNAWVRQGHTCTTPNELVVALISDDGLPDTTTEIVDCDHGSLQLLSHQIRGLETSFANLAGRANDIVYEFDMSPASIHREENAPAFDWTRCPSVWSRAFKYSQVGLDILLELEITEKASTLQACEDADTIDSNEEDGEDETCEANWEQSATADNDGEGNNEEDSDMNLSSEIVLPRCAVGIVIGVRALAKHKFVGER